MTEELLVINKVLGFLEDLFSNLFRAGHPLLMFTKKDRNQKYKIPSKTLAACVKHDLRIVLKN